MATCATKWHERSIDPALPLNTESVGTLETECPDLYNYWDMKVNKLGNLVDMGPKNESFRIPILMCLSVTFKQDSGFAASCNGVSNIRVGVLRLLTSMSERVLHSGTSLRLDRYQVYCTWCLLLHSMTSFTCTHQCTSMNGIECKGAPPLVSFSSVLAWSSQVWSSKTEAVSSQLCLFTKESRNVFSFAWSVFID